MVARFGVSTLLCGSDCSFSVSVSLPPHRPSLPPSSGAFWPLPWLLLALGGGALHFPNPFLSFFFIIFLLILSLHGFGACTPRVMCRDTAGQQAAERGPLGTSNVPLVPSWVFTLPMLPCILPILLDFPFAGGPRVLDL